MAVVALVIEARLSNCEGVLFTEDEKTADVLSLEQEIVVRKHHIAVASDQFRVTHDQTVKWGPLRPDLVFDEAALILTGRRTLSETRENEIPVAVAALEPL